MNNTFLLIDAELAFLTVRVIEGHRLDEPSHLARDALWDLGVIPCHSHKLYEFEYLWQEQGKIDIFDTETGEMLIAPAAPCPWPDVETFLRRWDEILPEIVARDFEKNHNPERHRLLIQKRPEIWGDVEVHPFTAEEAGFLDALADEVRSRSLGPCLRALVARSIHHFQTLELVERRWFELTEQGQSWPQPHRPDPPCPWQDRQAFADRFDRELHPHLHYPMKESWKTSIGRASSASEATESDLNAN